MKGIRKYKPLTIEELRFAMVGDDDTNLTRILYQMFHGGLSSFGEAAHYFKHNANDRFKKRLADHVGVNYMLHPLVKRPPKGIMVVIVMGSDAQGRVSGMLFEGYNFGNIDIKPSPLFNSYDIELMEMTWICKILKDLSSIMDELGMGLTDWTPPSTDELLELSKDHRVMTTAYVSKNFHGMMAGACHSIAHGNYNMARDAIVNFFKDRFSNMPKPANFGSKENHEFHLRLSMTSFLRRTIHFSGALDAVLSQDLP